jgi:hypothetical protein
MGICPAQSFRNITPDEWQTLVERAAQNNIPLGGDSGQSTQQGFTFCWEYDVKLSILTIQCLDHPFLVPCSAIRQYIQALIGDRWEPTNAAPAPDASTQEASCTIQLDPNGPYQKLDSR